MQNHQPQHAVMIAVADNGKPKIKPTRPSAAKPTGAKPFQECKQSNQDFLSHGAPDRIIGLEKRVYDLHSITGQLMKEIQQLQQYPEAENRQPNCCTERGSQAELGHPSLPIRPSTLRERWGARLRSPLCLETHQMKTTLTTIAGDTLCLQGVHHVLVSKWIFRSYYVLVDRSCPSL
jgi:hypothetical protein